MAKPTFIHQQGIFHCRETGERFRILKQDGTGQFHPQGFESVTGKWWRVGLASGYLSRRSACQAIEAQAMVGLHARKG